MDIITVYFDGGCRPTNPGNKYGSYEVRLNGKVVGSTSRMQLGWGTNNEAEWETLIKALEWSVNQLLQEHFCPSDYMVKLFTDSTIVRNRINGKNRTQKSEPQRRMYQKSCEALKILKMFKCFTIEWRSRVENVARFGH